MKISYKNQILNSFDDLFKTKINNPNILVKDDKYILNSGAKTDFFIAADDTYRTHTAPLALFEISNNEPFCFSASIEPKFEKTYDAGALFIYESDISWLKLAFEIDELGFTRIVSVYTNGYSDDANHEHTTEKSVFLKIASDTKTIACYFSPNGIDWRLARIFKNKFNSKIFIGLTSQSPIGEGCETAVDEIKFSIEKLDNYRLGN